MKCIGAEKPPCTLCAKTGRLCVLPQSNKLRGTSANAQRLQQSYQQCPPLTPQTLRYVPNGPEQGSNPELDIRQDIRPPVYRSNTTPVTSSGTGFEAVPAQGHWSSLSPHAARPPGDSTFQHAPTNSGYDRNSNVISAWHVANDDRTDRTSVDNTLEGVTRGGLTSPSEEDVLHLSRFFEANLLHHIPIITQHDLIDSGTTSWVRQPLAYCMAYVAAHFVPGCRATRIALSASITPIARLQFERYRNGESTEESQWRELQALAILYNWAPSHYPDSSVAAFPDDLPAELRQDMLRASIETLARRRMLHRSAFDVSELLKSNVPDVQQSLAFRKYLFWLWLFSEAHVHALVSQSPPTIREDASIIQAIPLLGNVVSDDYARQILARVDLCLLWSRGPLHERGLGQWWCSVPNQMSLESLLALLDDLDAATRRWHQIWHPNNMASIPRKAARPDRDDTTILYYHFTSFCIGNYVAAAIQSSTTVGSVPYSSIHSLTKTVSRGNALCRSFLELSPLAKYSACFNPEVVYAMITSCCQLLIQILRSTTGPDLNNSTQLSTIRQVAELMGDLSFDEKQGTKGRGQRIIATLSENEAARRLSIPSQRPAHHKRSVTWTAGVGEQRAAHALLSFSPGTESVLSAQQVSNQREPMNGHQHGPTASLGEHIGMWPSYQTSEPVGSADPYWMS